MKIIDSRISTSDSVQQLHLHSRLPEITPRAIIVLSHGFQDAGFGVHRIFLRMADLLVKQGFGAVLFDYRGSGYSDGAFEDFTISQEVEDLKTVVEYAQKEYKVPIGVVGHSMGGTVAATATSAGVKIDALVLWSALFDVPSKFSMRIAAEDEWQDHGEFVCHPATGYFLRKNIVADAAKYYLYDVLSKITVPTLLWHGTEDKAVSIEQSEKALELLFGEKKLIRAEGATHSLRCQSEAEKQLMVEVVEWMEEHLGELKMIN